MIQWSYKVQLPELQYNDYSSEQWALSSLIGKPIEGRLNRTRLQKLAHFVLIQPVIQLQSSWIYHLDYVLNWSWIPWLTGFSLIFTQNEEVITNQLPLEGKTRTRARRLTGGSKFPIWTEHTNSMTFSFDNIHSCTEGFTSSETSYWTGFGRRLGCDYVI